MKKSILYLTLVAFCYLLFSHCKTDFNQEQNPKAISNTNAVSLLKENFFKKNLISKLSMKINDTVVVNWIPDWSHYRVAHIGDTLEYYYFKLNPETYNLKQRRASSQIEEVDSKRYLVIGKTKTKIYNQLVTYYFDLQPGTLSISSMKSQNIFKNFSGSVTYRNIETDQRAIAIYKNGVSSMRSVRGLKQSTLKTSSTQQCDTFFDCTYFYQCDYVYRIVDKIRQKTCSSSLPPMSYGQGCRQITQEAYLSQTYMYNACYEIEDPTPPNPSDPGGDWPTPPPPVNNCGACNGVGEKCINGTCEVGTMVVESTVKDESSGDWACYYHYEFSDHSWSDTYIQWGTQPCY